MAEFSFVEAFKIKDADTDLKATVTFESGDFSKPLSVFIMDRAGSSVSIPFDLFDRFVAGVRQAADQ